MRIFRLISFMAIVISAFLMYVRYRDWGIYLALVSIFTLLLSQD